MPAPRLLHVQTTTLLEFPQNLAVVRIGKASSNWSPDIDVSTFPNSDIVSRSHAEIHIQGNAYFIEDLGSSNGTFLNHSRLTPFTPCQLHFGDRIDLGKEGLFTFLFREARQQTVAASSSGSTENYRPNANIPVPTRRAMSMGGEERNQQNQKQKKVSSFNVEEFILNNLASAFSSLISFFSNLIGKLIKWLIRIAIRIGIFLIALFVIGLLAALLLKSLSDPPVVARGGGSAVENPAVEIPVNVPVKPPVEQPQKRLVEPRRIRVPYTNENRPAGQASCDCPYDRAVDSSLCGGRSAYVRPGGNEPACYEGETTARELWWNTPSTAFVDRERKGR